MQDQPQHDCCPSNAPGSSVRSNLSGLVGETWWSTVVSVLEVSSCCMPGCWARPRYRQSKVIQQQDAGDSVMTQLDCMATGSGACCIVAKLLTLIRQHAPPASFCQPVVVK
jgi:hypothetical protein